MVKVFGGVLFGSAALIADALHSFSDFLSDILVIFGLRHSNKPPDAEHPIGHGKIEYVLSLFLGMMVLFMAYQVFYNLFANIGETPVVPSIYGMGIAGGVIIAKLFLARYLLFKAENLESQVLKASGQESFTDVLGSVVVIIGIALALIGARINNDLLLYGDLLAAFVIGLFILRVAILIIVDAVRSMIGKSAPKTTLQKTKDIAESIEGVIRVDKLTMIVYGHYYQVLVDIRVDGTISVKEGHDVANEVKRALLSEKNIGHVIVHVNPEG